MTTIIITSPDALKAYIARVHPDFVARGLEGELYDALVGDSECPAFGGDWSDFLEEAAPRCRERAETPAPEEEPFCDTCQGAKWGTSVPLPGVLVTTCQHVETCDECGVYATDFDAAVALAAECRERGLSDRIRHTVDGYEDV